jgi:phage baseplate assembly protein gpV
MTKRLLRPVLALVAALGMAGAASATASPAPTTKTQTTHHSAKGKIEAYDAGAHSLTLKTAKGSETFDVAAAKVWSGSKSVGAEQLASAVGSEATVSYTMKDKDRHASAVHLTAEKAKTK